MRVDTSRIGRIVLSRRVMLATLIGTAILAAMTVAALRWANVWAVADGRRAAEQMARTHAGLFSSELQKYRLLPLVLTEYPEVQGALSKRPGAIAELDDKLELLARRTSAAVIYLLDDKGIAVAASNSRLPTSFVGHDYRFRTYFRDALAKGHAEEFALGAVTRRPGLFLATPVMRDAKPIGVIVVKVEFDQIEDQWRAQDSPTVVLDSSGTVMLTSQSGWRFRKLALASGAGAAPALTEDGRRFVVGEAAVPIEGWTLRHFEPLDPFEATPATLVREILFAAAILIIVTIGLTIRAREKQVMQRENQRMLEREVERRTAELRDSNERLRVESIERQQADQKLRAAREELAQANRLGILGQVTAGVAHEVNQPVAAIRTCAENASRLIARSQIERTQHNLGRIVELTDRIGRITQELRQFARRGTPVVGTVDLDAALDGALLLLADRIRTGHVKIERRRAIGRLAVVADGIRLEQIFVNLVQNALDALANTTDPRITLSVEDGEDAIVGIADNGPGIAPDMSDTLFTPFVTGKATGLGLGLGIARDIAREFGGDITVLPAPGGGAVFQVRLRKANV